MPYEGGSGTQSDPYQISTQTHFESIADNLGSYFVLTDNVDAGGSSMIVSGTFTGNLDGNGYTVSNVTLSLGQFGTGGVFEEVSGATVEDIVFDNVTVNGGFNNGLFGENVGSGTTINRVNVKNSTTSSTQGVGVLFGRISSPATITETSLENCSFEAVSNSNVTTQNTGLMIGSVQANTTLKDCYVSESSSSGPESGYTGSAIITGSVTSGNTLDLDNFYVENTSLHHQDGDGLTGNTQGTVNGAGAYIDSSTVSYTSSYASTLTTSEMQ